MATKPSETTASERYAHCIALSKAARWDIDADVIRGRQLDAGEKFLPDGLTQVRRLPFLTREQGRFLSQVQGRTYANMFGLVERYISAKVLELSGDYWLGDQTALEALVRFGDEELKHQALFRHLEELTARSMPDGYAFDHDPNQVARAVLSKCTWAVLALTCNIELLTQSHYRQSIGADPELSRLYRDVFEYHWKEECQHAVLDELEWRREDARLTDVERDRAVDDLIALVGAVDGVLKVQADADARYFAAVAGPFTDAERESIDSTVLGAYRWQYIVSGAEHPRFAAVLQELATTEQLERIGAALTPIVAGTSGDGAA
ncbi:MAG: hypothetical protein JXB36_05385 [Gammaproteobacteria bacterium]|nr:hypothetical protein [Gammaproteobacteria bacterium]